MSRGKGAWSWSSSVLTWQSGRDEAERALVAVGAARGIPAGQASIEILPGLAMSAVRLWRCGGAEQLPCSGDEACATPVGLETEVPDTDEASREDVLEESLDEGRCLDGEKSPGLVVLSIAIAKGHEAILEGDQPLVSDGDSVGVSTEISKDLGRARQRSLAVDDPLSRRRLAY